MTSLLVRRTQREYYDSLPDVVKVYRGTLHPMDGSGLSWTLNRPVAVMFAKRLKLPGMTPKHDLRQGPQGERDRLLRPPCRGGDRLLSLSTSSTAWRGWSMNLEGDHRLGARPRRYADLA
jgi:hypothetical protein